MKAGAGPSLSRAPEPTLGEGTPAGLSHVYVPLRSTYYRAMHEASRSEWFLCRRLSWGIKSRPGLEGCNQ